MVLPHLRVHRTRVFRLNGLDESWIVLERHSALATRARLIGFHTWTHRTKPLPSRFDHYILGVVMIMVMVMIVVVALGCAAGAHM
jgi:hypothetical protein